ncbi:MAG TPA: hypothetical protein VK574_13690 [Terracidiphilus sp.]|nr:hypothetical protein [Terracidiphilus sp.]
MKRGACSLDVATSQGISPHLNVGVSLLLEAVDYGSDSRTQTRLHPRSRVAKALSATLSQPPESMTDSALTALFNT